MRAPEELPVVGDDRSRQRDQVPASGITSVGVGRGVEPTILRISSDSDPEEAEADQESDRPQLVGGQPVTLDGR